MSDGHAFLHDVTSTQPVADMFKALVSAVRPADSVDARKKRRALRLISVFEGQDWSPPIFLYILSGHATGTFKFVPAGALYTPDEYSEDTQSDLLTDVVDVLYWYNKLITPDVRK